MAEYARPMASGPGPQGSPTPEIWIPEHRVDPLYAAAGALTLAVIVGLVWLWPGGASGRFAEQLELIGIPRQSFPATVAAVEDGPCEFTADLNCRTVVFELGEGPDEGGSYTQVFPEGETTPDFAAGDGVVLGYTADAEPEFRYQYQDRQRRPVLLWTTIAFAAVVIALGRWRGVAAIAGLGASIIVLLLFILPAILEGSEPVVVALVGSGAIAVVALYVTHGFSAMTTVALLGTLGALSLTAGLSWLVLELAQISGLASEEAVFLTLFEGIDIRGLVLAGTVLGAAGALDDVTVTQSSAVWELRAANPGLGRRRLFTAGLRIGRDHIGSTVNTLLLAYAGAALPLLVLFVVSEQSLGTIANSETVAIEIIRTLVGSIGLVVAVPLTTWLAAHRAARPSR